MKTCPELRVSVVEYGERFETGVPVTVRYLRNTRPSPKPGPTDQYQQRIEPAGRYMIHNPGPAFSGIPPKAGPGDLPRGWESGMVRFESPLVIPLNSAPDEPIYGPSSWKAELSRAYKGKTGKALSSAIARSGYDAIVTVTLDKHCRPIDTREIVDLSMFRGSYPRG